MEEFAYSFVRHVDEEAASPTNSPVRSVVGQVMPGCELAPGAYVRPRGIYDARDIVPRTVLAREPVARCRRTVASFDRHPRLECKYNMFCKNNKQMRGVSNFHLRENKIKCVYIYIYNCMKMQNTKILSVLGVNISKNACANRSQRVMAV